MVGYSRAVKVGNRVVVAGTAPIWPDGSVNLEPKAQAERCLEIILAALAEAGASPEHVVGRRYITDAAHADAVGKAHGAVFGEIRPASTMVVVAGLLDPRWKVEIEAEAIIDSPRTLSPTGRRPGSCAVPRRLPLNWTPPTKTLSNSCCAAPAELWRGTEHHEPWERAVASAGFGNAGPAAAEIRGVSPQWLDSKVKLARQARRAYSPGLQHSGTTSRRPFGPRS